mgnify:CR=1 FL=1
MVGIAVAGVIACGRGLIVAARMSLRAATSAGNVSAIQWDDGQGCGGVCDASDCIDNACGVTPTPNIASCGTACDIKVPAFTERTVHGSRARSRGRLRCGRSERPPDIRDLAGYRQVRRRAHQCQYACPPTLRALSAPAVWCLTLNFNPPPPRAWAAHQTTPTTSSSGGGRSTRCSWCKASARSLPTSATAVSTSCRTGSLSRAAASPAVAPVYRTGAEGAPPRLLLKMFVVFCRKLGKHGCHQPAGCLQALHNDRGGAAAAVADGGAAQLALLQQVDQRHHNAGAGRAAATTANTNRRARA